MSGETLPGNKSQARTIKAIDGLPLQEYFACSYDRLEKNVFACRFSLGNDNFDAEAGLLFEKANAGNGDTDQAPNITWFYTFTSKMVKTTLLTAAQC